MITVVLFRYNGRTWSDFFSVLISTKGSEEQTSLDLQEFSDLPHQSCVPSMKSLS